MNRILLVALLLVAGCSRSDKGAQAPPAEPSSPALSQAEPLEPVAFERIGAKHLPNPVRVHPKVISGGLPEGEEAFAELEALGIKTVISVDGMCPDVELAQKHGMRYVHLPHGYDGIPDDRVKQLAKAVRELEGPIYIHCHHGKHRSPTAASVACVAAGLVPESQSVAILELAGTSPKYRGLYQSAREAKPLEASLLEELEAEFPEQAQLPVIAEAMVALEHTYGNMKSIELAGWRSPTDHPDLHPAHEALLLREHYTEMLRTDEVKQQPEEYRQLLHDSEEAAQQMEDLLRQWQTASADRSPPAELAQLTARISNNCATCHEKFRDVPLDEK
jgi:protein tyrosine phosphatase (PTP) superfamily phosphohydrolase (DUF442 family)